MGQVIKVGPKGAKTVEFAGFLGNTAGYRQFGEWVDAFDAKEAAQIGSLWEHGGAGPARELQENLSDCLAKRGKQLKPGGKAVALSLLKILEGLPDEAYHIIVCDEYAEA